MPIDRKELGEVIQSVEALSDYCYNLRLGDFMQENKARMLAAETPPEQVEVLVRQLHSEVRDHLSPSRRAAVALATSNVYIPEYEESAGLQDFSSPPVDREIGPEQILAAIRAELLK